MVLTRIAQGGTKAADGFRMAVSLHSHTHHSQEVLEFLPRLAERVPFVSAALRRAQRNYELRYGRRLDFSQFYWRPPLSPRAVFESEAGQIRERLHTDAMVSITDHDSIDAGLALRLLGEELTPVSVEWTVPYRGTIFHLGVHNLPAASAATTMQALRAFTREPREPRLAELLAWLHESPSTLLVLNHPLWNGNNDRDQDHDTLKMFVSASRRYLHATEINGYRDHAENRSVIRLGAEWQLPIVAGGDRHGRAPNAMLNLTHASTFDQFVDQVRHDRRSNAIVLPEYRQHKTPRVLEAASDVLRHGDDLEPGHQRWFDRVFAILEDGRHIALSEVWGDRAPLWARASVGLTHVLGSAHARRALNLGLVAENGGVL